MPTKTKQTTTPKPVAHRNRAPQTAGPSPNAVSEITRSGAPQTAGQERRLPTTHEIIIDAVSELLTHGGHVDDVDSLIHCAMAHTRRRQCESIFEGQPAEIDRHAAEFIRKGFDQWKIDLAIAWRANKRPERPEFDATTISDRIRARRRDVLLDRFDGFMRTATPEELYIMSDILWIWDSGMSSAVAGVDEIPLGEAFGNVLDREDTYIRIPKEFRAKVQCYVDALLVVSDKAVA